MLQEQRLVMLEWFKPALGADAVAELDYRKYTSPAQVRLAYHAQCMADGYVVGCTIM